ncbi:MAG: hypothetical protein HY873_08645 [Chloroflexi bacterium]|nr:hypothetical protein [Chloroflexota bacterium]
MTQQDSTIANADLWSKYFQEQWSAWLRPFAGSDAPTVAAGAGARMANLLTLVAAGPIAWLYANNAPNVTPIRPERPATDYSHEMESVEEHAA